MLADGEVTTALRAGSEEALAAVAAAALWRAAHITTAPRKPGEFNYWVLPSERQALLALRRKVAQQAFRASGALNNLSRQCTNAPGAFSLEEGPVYGFKPCASGLDSLRRYAAPAWNEMDDPSRSERDSRAVGRPRPHRAADRLWKPRRWIDAQWVWATDPANAARVCFLSPRKVLLWQAGDKHSACDRPLSMEYVELAEGDTVAQCKHRVLPKGRVRRHITIIRRCRQCRGCMYARGLHWAHRAHCEELTSKAVHFVTLTLPDEYYTPLSNYVRSTMLSEGVDYDAAPGKYRLRLFQIATGAIIKRFVVALRRFCSGGRSKELMKDLKPVRLVRVSELGERTGRFHMHLIVHVQESSPIVPTMADYVRLWKQAWTVDGKVVDVAKGPWVKLKVPKPGQSVRDFTRYCLKYVTKTGEDPVFARIGAARDYGSEAETHARWSLFRRMGFKPHTTLIDLLDHLTTFELWTFLLEERGYNVPGSIDKPAGFVLPQRE